MKIKLTILFMMLTIGAFAEFFPQEMPPLPEKTDVASSPLKPYVKGGALLIFPNFGVGMQYRTGNFGVDVSANWTVHYVDPMLTFISIRSLCQYYLTKPFYIGAGAGWVVYHQEWATSFPVPEISVGYEFAKGKQFIQLETFISPRGVRMVALPEISYGIRF